jgi:hemolysin-activating ACP:hemolysin acyltransferase
MIQPEVLLEALELRARFRMETPPESLLYLTRSARKGMLRILRDKLRRPVGYVAWAEVNKESLRRMQRVGLDMLAHYEWDEGHLVVIVDAAFAPGRARCLAQPLMAAFARRRVVVLARSHAFSLYARSGAGFRHAHTQRFARAFAPVRPLET